MTKPLLKKNQQTFPRHQSQVWFEISIFTTCFEDKLGNNLLHCQPSLHLLKKIHLSGFSITKMKWPKISMRSGLAWHWEYSFPDCGLQKWSSLYLIREAKGCTLQGVSLSVSSIRQLMAKGNAGWMSPRSFWTGCVARWLVSCFLCECSVEWINFTSCQSVVSECG